MNTSTKEIKALIKGSKEYESYKLHLIQQNKNRADSILLNILKNLSGSVQSVTIGKNNNDR